MTADPRTVGGGRVGTPLRDAAVNPEADDYLAPINAGKEGEAGNPHGPNVVSPEVHASQGVRPVRPGPVSPTVDVQDAEETAHAAAWADGKAHDADPAAGADGGAAAARS